MANQAASEIFSITDSAPTPAQRLEELKLELPPHVDYQLETVFPKVSGWGWKKEIRNKQKLIQNVHPLLEQCLLPGEHVQYLAKGNRYSFLEFYFLGLWAKTINHTVFVLTNLRLLMFRTDSKGRPKKTFWMIFYSQIKKFRGSWTGMLNLKLNDRRTLQFSGFKKGDRKAMPQIFQTALNNYQQRGFDPPTSQSLENLCSHCLEQVPKQQYHCEGCQTAYWTPGQLALRSFVFPSWGDFLMGHTTIACLEMIGGIFTWSIMLLMIIAGVLEKEPAYFFTGLFVFLIGNGLDALVTAIVASKGLHPMKVRPATVTPVE